MLPCSLCSPKPCKKISKYLFADAPNSWNNIASIVFDSWERKVLISFVAVSMIDSRTWEKISKGFLATSHTLFTKADFPHRNYDSKNCPAASWRQGVSPPWRWVIFSSCVSRLQQTLPPRDCQLVRDHMKAVNATCQKRHLSTHPRPRTCHNPHLLHSRHHETSTSPSPQERK